MVCGIDTNILGLDKLKAELVKKVQDLATPPKGLKAAIDSVSAIVSKEVPAIAKKLAESIPGLAGLIPKATLQGDMTALLGMISNPAGFASQAAAIVSKYGTVPGVDIAGLASSILSGNISADTICKFIPNVEIDALNNIIKKGVIPVPPTKAVEKLPDLIEQAKASKIFANAYKAAGELSAIISKTGATLPTSVTNATAPGGIMSVMSQQFKTLTGAAIPPEVIKAMTGAPGALTLACASGTLEEQLKGFQAAIAAGIPKEIPTIIATGESFTNVLGEASNILSNFPVSAAGATIAEQIKLIADNAAAGNFPDEGGGGSGEGTVDGGDEDGTAATVSGDADTSGA